jgi:hypothetical protein
MPLRVTIFTTETLKNWPIQAGRFNENPGIGHKKGRCHCQGVGEHRGYWGCEGMAEAITTGSLKHFNLTFDKLLPRK